ncbi:hypothetical protein SS50377_25775 [Spironucleus salmonicida]|uniref:Protein kinase domain-containing protein n=1 Tax=Spironucleus salmonicida TaxID=348837 RepID=V6M4J3_9EUKA|nr:hypothetical protein SS50377_25775 [Spironucleus salmonicida]|eukprot:EST48249.1 Hypothetical protein SS50377_11590 [Spironucleus salmonicida]
MQKIINTYSKIPSNISQIQEDQLENTSADVKKSGHLELLNAQIGDFTIVEILCETNSSTLCVANYNNVLYTLKVARTLPYFQDLMLKEIQNFHLIQTLDISPKLVRVQTSLPVFLAYKFEPLTLDKALHINKTGFNIDLVKQFGCQLISLAKQLPFIHNNIQIKNILITDQLKLKLIDFNGIMDDNNTPYEQFAFVENDPTVWQIGHVLMHLYLGRSPFGQTIFQSMHNQLQILGEPDYKLFSIQQRKRLFDDWNDTIHIQVEEQIINICGQIKWKYCPNLNILNAFNQAYQRVELDVLFGNEFGQFLKKVMSNNFAERPTLDDVIWEWLE